MTKSAEQWDPKLQAWVKSELPGVITSMRYSTHSHHPSCGYSEVGMCTCGDLYPRPTNGDFPG